MSAGYGELAQNQIVFFSHLIPGEQKGYNVFIDQKMGLNPIRLVAKPFANRVWCVLALKFSQDCDGHSNLTKKKLQKFFTADDHKIIQRTRVGKQRSSRKDSIDFGAIAIKSGFIILQESKVLLEKCFCLEER